MDICKLTKKQHRGNLRVMLFSALFLVVAVSAFVLFSLKENVNTEEVLEFEPKLPRAPRS